MEESASFAMKSCVGDFCVYTSQLPTNSMHYAIYLYAFTQFLPSSLSSYTQFTQFLLMQFTQFLYSRTVGESGQLPIPFCS